MTVRIITEAAAFWGIISGMLGNIGSSLLKVLGLIELPVILDPILIGALISYLTIEIVSRCSEVTPEEHALREAMHVAPESEFDSAKLHRTLMWSRALMVFGVVLTVLLFLLYVMPYQQATDEFGMTGELILSISIGVAMVVSGALAYRGAIRSFSRESSASSSDRDRQQGNHQL